MLVILHREKSSLPQGNAHDAQILWLNNVVKRPIHIVLAGWFRLALEPEKLLIIPPEWNRAPGSRYARNTRERLNPAVKFANRGANRFGFAAHHGRWKRKPKCHGIMRIKPGISLPQVRQAPDHQASPNQQHQRQRHLRNHEYRLRAMARTGCATRALLQGLDQFVA